LLYAYASLSASCYDPFRVCRKATTPQNPAIKISFLDYLTFLLCHNICILREKSSHHKK
jgi:hypothetical protein